MPVYAGGLGHSPSSSPMRLRSPGQGSSAAIDIGNAWSPSLWLIRLAVATSDARIAEHKPDKVDVAGTNRSAVDGLLAGRSVVRSSTMYRVVRECIMALWWGSGKSRAWAETARAPLTIRQRQVAARRARPIPEWVVPRYRDRRCA